MEFIAKKQISCLSNPGVDSYQLLNPENSLSERITITKVVVQPKAVQPRHIHETSEQIWIATKGTGILLLSNDEEKTFNCGDVVRFAEKDVHGLRNDSTDIFEYISVTSPPINFNYAYAGKK